MSPPGGTARQHANGVFDLDAAAAAAEEADAVPFRFTYKGAEYEMPPASKWPLTALRSFAAGDLDAALTGLLGPVQLDKLTADGLTVGEMNVLFEQAGESAGFGNLPNSGPPQRRGSTRR